MTAEVESNVADHLHEPSGLIILDTKIGIEDIAALTEQLTAAASASGPVRIDIGNVTSVDTAALQVLVAFANSMRARSRVLDWQGHADVLRESAELIDVDTCLGIRSIPSDTEAVPVALDDDDGLCPVF